MGSLIACGFSLRELLDDHTWDEVVAEAEFAAAYRGRVFQAVGEFVGSMFEGPKKRKRRKAHASPGGDPVGDKLAAMAAFMDAPAAEVARGR